MSPKWMISTLPTILHLCFLLDINYSKKTSDLSLAANILGLNMSRKKKKTMQLLDTPLSAGLEIEKSRGIYLLR